MTPGALVADRPFSFDRARARGAVAAAGDRGRTRRGCWPRRCRSRDDRRRRRSTTCSGSSGRRCAASSATGSTSPCPATRNRSTTGCPWRSTASPSGPSATGCSATCSPASDPEQRPPAGVAPRRAPSGVARLADALGDIARSRPSPIAGRGPPAAHPATATRSTSTSTSATGAGCAAPCPEVYGDRLVPVHLQPARRQPTAAGLDPAARAGGGRRGPGVDRAHALGRPTNSRSRASTASAISLLGPLDHTALDVLRDLVACATAGLTRAAAAAAEVVPRPTPDSGGPAPQVDARR